MSDFVHDYGRAQRREGYAATTIVKRVGELRSWLHWIGDRWDQADRHDVDDWLDSRRLAMSTRYVAISNLSAFYRWARLEDLCSGDPTDLGRRR